MTREALIEAIIQEFTMRDVYRVAAQVPVGYAMGKRYHKDRHERGMTRKQSAKRAGKLSAAGVVGGYLATDAAEDFRYVSSKNFPDSRFSRAKKAAGFQVPWHVGTSGVGQGAGAAVGYLRARRQDKVRRRKEMQQAFASNLSHELIKRGVAQKRLKND